MKQTPQDIINMVIQTEVAVDLDRLLLTKSVGIKPDPVALFILKYVYIQHHTVGNVTMTELSSLLHESDLTIRKKVKTLAEIGQVKLVKSANDKRVTYIMPTKALIRHFEIHTHRLFATILEQSPIMNMVFNAQFKEFQESLDTEKHPSFLDAGDHLYGYYKKLHDLYANQDNDYAKNTVNKLQ